MLKVIAAGGIVSMVLLIPMACCPCRPSADEAARATLLESFDAPPQYHPATFWQDIESLIAREHFWRAVLLLRQADPEGQAFADLERRQALPLGLLGFSLYFPGIGNHMPFREVEYRTMGGTTDAPRSAGQSAWNMEAEFWAEEYNWTLIARSDPHRLLESGTYTVDQYEAATAGRDPTTMPWPSELGKDD